MQRAKEDESSPATPMQDSYHNFRSPSPPTPHFWEAPLDSETRLAQCSLSPIVPTQARSLSASPPRLLLSKRKAPPSPKTIVGPFKKVRFIKTEALILTHLLLVTDAKIDWH